MLAVETRHILRDGSNRSDAVLVRHMGLLMDTVIKCLLKEVQVHTLLVPTSLPLPGFSLSARMSVATTKSCTRYDLLLRVPNSLN